MTTARKCALLCAIAGGVALAIWGPAYVASPDGPGDNPASPDCRANWRACTGNADLMTDWHGMRHVQYLCRQQATAIGGPARWPGGWDVRLFDLYLPGDSYVRTGIVELHEKRGQFRDRQGSWRIASVTCAYALGKGAITHIDIQFDPE